MIDEGKCQEARHLPDEFVIDCEWWRVGLSAGVHGASVRVCDDQEVSLREENVGSSNCPCLGSSEAVVVTIDDTLAHLFDIL